MADHFLTRTARGWLLERDDAQFIVGGPGWLDATLATVRAADMPAHLAHATPHEEPSVNALAPVETQEVWAAGVTYKRSEEARERESDNSSLYTRVYHAERPELFYKSAGPDAVGSGDSVGIRADATWSVPEPELCVVFNAWLEVVGFTIGNDMSSRDIEGANPLYLPQAKMYDRACALGPRIWLQPGAQTWPELPIEITISRAGAPVFHGTVATTQIHRTLADLRGYLGRCRTFGRGAFLLTGTGIVPPDTFTLAAADEVRISIAPIGELVNTVVTVGGDA